MLDFDNLDPDLDDLAEIEDEDVSDLDSLLDGIVDDEYVSEWEIEDVESLDALAEAEGDVFDPWAAAGAGWDEV